MLTKGLSTVKLKSNFNEIVLQAREDEGKISMYMHIYVYKDESLTLSKCFILLVI